MRKAAHRQQPGVVVIAGASSGVGRASADAFAARGYAVVLAARRAAELAEVARHCRTRRGTRALAVPTDLTDAAAVERLARQAVAAFGRIDVWINSAAVAAFGSVEEVPPEIFHRVLDLDVLGHLHGARSALRVMRRQGRGTLINFSSAVGAVPVPYNAAYVVSKAAVRALGTCLRQELRLEGQRDIRVCTVLPASLDTPFFASAANYSGRRVIPMAPVYTPERAARKALALVRRPRPESYVGPAAAVLTVQGRLAPGFTERIVARQTNRAQLSPTQSAPTTGGNVVQPAAGGAVHGGWHGRRRTAVRRTATAALLTGAGYVALRRARRG